MKYYKDNGNITVGEIIDLVSDNKKIKQIGAIIGIIDGEYHFSDNMINQFSTMLEALLHRKKKLKETEFIDDNDRFLKLVIGPDVNIENGRNEKIISEWFNKIEAHNHRIMVLIY